MSRKHRIRIHETFIPFHHRIDLLRVGAVVGAEETTAGGDGCGIYFSARRDGTRGVKDGPKVEFVCLDVACLHVGERLGVGAGQRPLPELVVDKLGDAARFLARGLEILFGGKTFAGLDLNAAEQVLIDVVGVNAFLRERCVGIAAPAAAEIQRVENAPYAVTPRYAQPQRVILAVADIGHPYLAQQRGEERTRSAQTVDTQGVVVTVVVGPLLVVNQTGRQRIAVEIRKLV